MPSFKRFCGLCWRKPYFSLPIFIPFCELTFVFSPLVDGFKNLDPLRIFGLISKLILVCKHVLLIASGWVHHLLDNSHLLNVLWVLLINEPFIYSFLYLLFKLSSLNLIDARHSFFHLLSIIFHGWWRQDLFIRCLRVRSLSSVSSSQPWPSRLHRLPELFNNFRRIYRLVEGLKMLSCQIIDTRGERLPQWVDQRHILSWNNVRESRIAD